MGVYWYLIALKTFLRIENYTEGFTNVFSLLEHTRKGEKERGGQREKGIGRAQKTDYSNKGNVDKFEIGFD